MRKITLKVDDSKIIDSDFKNKISFGIRKFKPQNFMYF